MSFSRHEEIYRSDGRLGKAGNGNWCRRSQCSSAAMSFQSAIPWQVALRQSLSPLHRLQTILHNQPCRTMILQPTATTPLTSCLSPRVHSSQPPPLRTQAYPQEMSATRRQPQGQPAQRCLIRINQQSPVECGPTFPQHVCKSDHLLRTRRLRTRKGENRVGTRNPWNPGNRYCVCL